MTTPGPTTTRSTLARVALPLGALAVAGASLSPAVALGLGAALALTLGNPYRDVTKPWGSRLLTASVVALGAGMDLGLVARVGLDGLGYTAAGIATALVVGSWLGRWLRVRGPVSRLVTVGTSICGGSAIAAVSPVIGATDEESSVALAVVFLLNAVALVLFPLIGHALALGEHAFGLWCALAIHDTSSVVGAAASYGPHALEVATSAKLARALWIVPLTFALAHRPAARSAGALTGPRPSPKRPWFIAGFVAIAALMTVFPGLRPVGHVIASGAHRLLALTLFLTGLGLSRDALRAVGARPLAQAVLLWIVLASATLAAIVHGVIA